MAYYRMRPPLIKQRLANSCWAAVLDSFSRVTKDVPRLRESELVSDFGLASNAGGLNATGVTNLTTRLATDGVSLQLIGTLSLPYDIEDRLRKSHVIAMYNVSGNDWHAWLVYGIDRYLIFLDPADGKLHSRPWVSHFVSGRGYYLIWKD